MAQIQAPLTPEQEAYAPLKTPEDRRDQPTHQPTTTYDSRFRAVGWLAQLLVFACIGFYIFGQVLVMTPLYNNKTAPNIQRWWGVPKGQAKGGTKGHSEMTRATYFTLFAVVPLLASVLLVEFLRHFNARRLTSQLLLKVALVLRRKPSLFGKVSVWSYGEIIFFLALVLGNVYVFVRYYVTRVKTKKPKKFSAYLECAGLSFGFTCLFNMAFLLLPATRNSAWMEFFNISYANSVKYHRWLGVVTVLTAFLHGVCYYWSWLREGKWISQAMPCFNCNFGESKSMKRWEYFFGELAFLLFVAMGVTAIPVVRRKFYNVFYYTHQLLFVAFFLIGLHWQYAFWWLLPTLVAYMLSRVVSATNGSAPVEVLEVTALSASLVKVVFKREAGRHSHYKVGQFLYLNVPAISKLQWHSFTVASSPRSSPTTVTVLLKSLGDWTQQLVEHANECKQQNILPTIYVDGFYGASLEMYDEYSTVCLVGGGIGVTPILSILNDMVAKLSHHEPLTQKVVFIFAFRELALFEELAPVLAKLRELDPQQQYVTFHLTLTGLASDGELDVALNHTKATTTVEPAAATSTAKPFTQPLQSSTAKSFAYLSAFAVVLVFVWLVSYGNKIKKKNAKLWALEQFTTMFLTIAGACVGVGAILLLERWTGRRGASEEPKTPAVHDLSLVHRELRTYRELLAEFGVVIGDQPNILTLLQQTYAHHRAGAAGVSPIGVFASGPESLKRAVEVAIAEIDLAGFDLRQEQFEL